VGIHRSHCVLLVGVWVGGCAPPSDELETSSAALSPSAISNLTIGTAAQTLAVGQCSAVVKINRRDDAGQLEPTPTYMDIELGGPGLTFYSDPACAIPTTTSFLGAGTHTNDIYFKATLTGAQVLTIGAAAHDGDFEAQNITGGAIAQLTLGTAPQTLDVGECSAVVKVNRRNLAGAIEATSTFMEIPLAGPGFTFFTDPACTNQITASWLGAGTHTNDVYFTNSLPGTQALAISANAHNGSAGAQILIGTAPEAAQITIGTAPQTVAANACSSVVKLERRDLDGNLAPTPVYMDIQLSGAGFTFYSDAACTDATTTSFLGAGTHTNDIYFRHSTAGSQTWSVAASGHDGDSQIETITGGGGGPPGSGPGPGTPYDLGQLPVEHRPAPPAAPVITNPDTNPTTTTALAAAGGTPNRRIIVNTDLSAGNITLSASNIELWIQPSGRVGTITIAAGVSRIRGHGGGIVRDLFMNHPGANDIAIDHLTFLTPQYGEWGGSSMELRGQRIAVTYCVNQAHRYSIWADGESSSDILVANNDFQSEGPESTVRIVGFDRSAVLNNRLDNGFKHNYRIHGTSVRYYAAHNVLIGSGMMLGTMAGDNLQYGIVRDNYIHWLRNGMADFTPSAMNTFHLVDNQLFADGWSCLYCGSSGPNWTVNNPPPEPWECPIARVAGAPPPLTCTQ
jgi:hypothetical protein